MNETYYTTYFVIDATLLSQIKQYGITKVRANFDEVLVGKVKADYNFTKNEIEKLKKEIIYSTNSFQKIKLDSKENIDKEF